MKHIYVIVLNYNGYENTALCLQTLLKSRIPQGFDATYVVVDNASHDNSFEKLKEKFPLVHVIGNIKNLGYSGGNNTGISFALKNGATHLLIINNDTIVTRDTVYELLLGMRENGYDVACPKIYFEKGYEYHKKRYEESDFGRVLWFAGGEMDWRNIIGYHIGVDEVDRGQFDEIKSLNFITGACFLARSEVFKKIGLFDDSYFLYYEDSDLSMRIKRAGFRIGFVPKSVIYHKNAGSTGGSGSNLQDYFITRNRLLFGYKYASNRAKFALLREAIRILLRGRVWQKRGVIDFFKKKFKKGSYPIS